MSAAEIEAVYKPAPAAVKPSASDKDPGIPGLVAYWPLDEGTGTKVSEAKGRLAPGTLQGSTTWTTGAGARPCASTAPTPGSIFRTCRI
jgi:hypothetical protein